MAQESIKALIQCEKDAKEAIEMARKERDAKKKQARLDAIQIVKSLKEAKESEIAKLRIENNEKLKIIEDEEKTKYEKKLSEMEVVLNKKKQMVDEIVKMIVSGKSEL